MRKSHLLIAGLSSIAIVGAIAAKALLQPLPPSNPSSPSSPPSLDRNPPLSNPEEIQPPSLPTEELSLPSQEALVNAVANLAIDNFQNASCEDLSQMQPSSEKSSAASSDPQAAMKEQAIAILKKNPEVREQFLNQVAPAIANKMFDCNIIP